MNDKKILIIDDDVNLGQTIKLTFARVGAEVFTAVDGRDGLRQFYEYRPDLVILDVFALECADYYANHLGQ